MICVKTSVVHVVSNQKLCTYVVVVRQKVYVRIKSLSRVFITVDVTICMPSPNIRISESLGRTPQTYIIDVLFFFFIDPLTVLVNVGSSENSRQKSHTDLVRCSGHPLWSLQNLSVSVEVLGTDQNFSEQLDP